MIAKNLFDDVLVKPVQNGADNLYIVSGYATAAMAFHHLEALKRNIGAQIHINLIVGMCPYDGLSMGNHKAFYQLAAQEFPDLFRCGYVFQPPQVHSKVYVWLHGDKPLMGFVGSANYTQNAFRGNQREVLANIDPKLCYEYYQNLVSNTVYCTHDKVENYIAIYRDTYYPRRNRELLEEQGLQLKTSSRPDLQDLPAIRISLLDNNDDLPQRSELNWGQRPEEHREPNQAYIRLPSAIYKTDFFPDVKTHFTVLTDDNKVLICTRAQDNGKAIHTPHNNSLIGEYFRHRLGIPSGNAVSKSDLVRYGRTNIDFYKIDDETYFMDFSVPA